MKYTITYDITDNKNRGKINKILKNCGVRTQFSVFEVSMKKSELEVLLIELSEYIDVKTDRLFAFPLKNKSDSINRIGKKIVGLGGII